MGGDRRNRPAGEHPQPADTLPVGTPDPTVSRRAYIHQSRNTDAGFPTTSLGDPPPTHEGGSRLLVTPGRGVCDLERLRAEYRKQQKKEQIRNKIKKIRIINDKIV